MNADARPWGAQDVIDLDRRFVSPGTRIPFLPLVARAGSGSRIVDQDGREFLDFHSMACITNTGHSHPRVVEAIRAQAETLLHCNPGYGFHEPLSRLAAELSAISPGSGEKKVAFGLSGADANDGAMKLVRAATGRSKVYSFFGSYHGNTYGALSLSSISLAMRRGFGPEVPDVHHLPFPNTYRPPAGVAAGSVVEHCLDAFARNLTTITPPEEVAAVFVEPIQGDSGIIVPPKEFLDELTAMCREHGILLVAEEVQTGMGRTGAWFASELLGFEPDVVIASKALASGLPLSAIMARDELMDAWKAPGHVFSTGANPVCCAAALATIDVIREEKLLENSETRGRQLREGFEEMAKNHDVIGDIRGRGLMLGVDLVEDRDSRARARTIAAKTLTRCFELGLYMTFLSGSVLRIAPPLVLTESEAERGLAIIDQALTDAVEGRVPDEAISELTGW